MRNDWKAGILLVGLVAVALAFAACGRDRQEKTSVKPAETTVDSSKTLRPPSPPPEMITVSGKVLEILDGGNFIFVLIDSGEEQSWATVPATEIKVGESISLDNATLFGKFYSKSLDRTFEPLIFASAVTGREPKRLAANSKDPSQRRSGRMLAGGGK